MSLEDAPWPVPQSRAERRLARLSVVDRYEANRARPTSDGAFDWYIRLGDVLHQHILHSKGFESLMAVFAVLTWVVAGCRTYPSLVDHHLLVWIDAMLRRVFFIEVFTKIVSETTRPWLFFYGSPHWKWNCYHFAGTGQPRSGSWGRRN